MQNTYQSDRLHPVYKCLRDNIRNGQMWGHLPENELVFTFFEDIKKYIDVKNILEFGYNLGFSSSYQLVVHPEANLVSYDRSVWHSNAAIYDEAHQSKVKIACWKLGKLAFGDRLTFHAKSSTEVTKDYKPGVFDYCFIDGNHSYEGAVGDIQSAIDLDIPYVVIDNIKNPEYSVSMAYKSFSNLKELNRIEYTAKYPRSDADGMTRYISDDIALFEVLKL